MLGNAQKKQGEVFIVAVGSNSSDRIFHWCLSACLRARLMKR